MPDCRPRELQAIERSTVEVSNDIRSPQRAQGLSQASGRQQPVFQIILGEQRDVEIPGQRAMLEAVIEDMKLRTELLLGQLPGFKAAFADNHRTFKTACDQQRLVSELCCNAVRIDRSGASRLTSISARKHVKAEPALPQHFSKHYDEWRLPGSASRNAAYA